MKLLNYTGHVHKWKHWIIWSDIDPRGFKMKSMSEYVHKYLDIYTWFGSTQFGHIGQNQGGVLRYLSEPRVLAAITWWLKPISPPFNILPTTMSIVHQYNGSKLREQTSNWMMIGCYLFCMRVVLLSADRGIWLVAEPHNNRKFSSLKQLDAATDLRQLTSLLIEERHYIN